MLLLLLLFSFKARLQLLKPMEKSAHLNESKCHAHIARLISEPPPKNNNKKQQQQNPQQHHHQQIPQTNNLSPPPHTHTSLPPPPPNPPQPPTAHITHTLVIISLLTLFRLTL